MAGRRPLPSAIKRLRGTDQPCRMNVNEPDPEPLQAKPPEHLSKEGKKYWRETFQVLDGIGVLTEPDADTLSLYCESKARWIYAKQKLEEDGLVIVAQSGFPVQSPWLQIANKAHEQLLKIAVEFGMTPSSRTRVKVVSDKKEPNPFDQFNDPIAELRNRKTGIRKTRP